MMNSLLPPEPHEHFGINLTEQIKAVETEIGYRKGVYPRMVEAGRLKPETMERKLTEMHAVLETLKSLQPEIHHANSQR